MRKLNETGLCPNVAFGAWNLCSNCSHVILCHLTSLSSVSSLSFRDIFQWLLGLLASSRNQIILLITVYTAGMTVFRHSKSKRFLGNNFNTLMPTQPYTLHSADYSAASVVQESRTAGMHCCLITVILLGWEFVAKRVNIGRLHKNPLD